MTTVSVVAGSARGAMGAGNTRLLIGRDPGCDIQIADGSVSRRHAELVLQGDQLLIRDLGSSNGTWINGEAQGRELAAVEPGSVVFVGVVPVQIEWSGGPRQGATRFEPDMAAVIQRSIDAARARSSAEAVAAAPASPASPTAALMGREAPDAGRFPYRVQGHNENGVLLIALPTEAFTNGDTLTGVVEYTATDNETVNGITVELVELHDRGPNGGHRWDQMIVRQGPWKAVKGDVVLLPFQLRVPAGTSVSGREVNWEVRGYVDIAWAYDIETMVPIQMRNTDIERIRDALGSLDYRVAELKAEPLGQKFIGSFQPSPTRIAELGITDVHFDVEYLGVNIKLALKVEKSSLFRFDKTESLVVDIGQLRAMTRGQLAAELQATIDRLMQK